MKIQILQHEDSTPPGSVLEWAKNNNYNYEIHFFSQGLLDHNTHYDVLVICGGGINVDQEALYPWLTDEKKFITAAIQKNKKIVGLCLGAQLLAESLGGKVFKAEAWEVGWQSVKLLESKRELMAFHWHGYQFTTPPHSTKIAENECTPHQGFHYGKNIIAFQFHPESTHAWVKECSEDSDLPPKAKWVQNKDEMIAGLYHQHSMKEWFFKELDRLIC
jgi:GMP synthase-like glutamine amidotransferase